VGHLVGYRPRWRVLLVDFVKALLNHNDKGVTGVYARWHMLEEKR
jgi:hypothetical protein